MLVVWRKARRPDSGIANSQESAANQASTATHPPHGMTNTQADASSSHFLTTTQQHQRFEPTTRPNHLFDLFNGLLVDQVPLSPAVSLRRDRCQLPARFPYERPSATTTRTLGLLAILHGQVSRIPPTSLSKRVHRRRRPIPSRRITSGIF